MPAFKDLTGKQFGRLIARQRDTTKPQGRPHRTFWICECICKNLVSVTTNDLLSGNTKSCGCFQRDQTSRANTKHGLRKDPLYMIYNGIKQRCENPRCKEYVYYGARGIRCEWKSVVSFYRDMGAAYQPGLSIERRNNNGPYNKKNCTWATRMEQGRNKRNNRMITYQGDTRTMAEWNRYLKFPKNMLNSRIHRGWSIHKALSTPTTH
jgi:hypothetical protein